MHDDQEKSVPGGVLIGLALSLLAGGANAQEIAIACPATDLLGPLVLRFSSNTLELVDAGATATLPASLNGDPAAIYTIAASGTMTAPMPPLAAFDACLSEKLAASGLSAGNTDDVAYVANSCRLQLKDSLEPREITARLEITVMAPGEAGVFITRTYVEPSTVTGAPVELAEFPMRTCPLTKAP